MTRIPAEDEAVTAPSSPLDNALAQLSAAVKTLGYDEGLHQMLAAPRREMAVSIPLHRDDGSERKRHGSHAEVFKLVRPIPGPVYPVSELGRGCAGVVAATGYSSGRDRGDSEQ